MPSLSCCKSGHCFVLYCVYVCVHACAHLCVKERGVCARIHIHVEARGTPTNQNSLIWLGWLTTQQDRGTPCLCISNTGILQFLDLNSGACLRSSYMDSRACPHVFIYGFRGLSSCLHTWIPGPALRSSYMDSRACSQLLTHTNKSFTDEAIFLPNMFLYIASIVSYPQEYV